MGVEPEGSMPAELAALAAVSSAEYTGSLETRHASAHPRFVDTSKLFQAFEPRVGCTVPLKMSLPGGVARPTLPACIASRSAGAQGWAGNKELSSHQVCAAVAASYEALEVGDAVCVVVPGKDGGGGRLSLSFSGRGIDCQGCGLSLAE